MTIPMDYGDVDWMLERLYDFHKEYQHVEREYLELRILLRDVETALRAEPDDGDLGVRMYYLKSFAVGFLLFISVSNLLVHILPVTYAFWTASFTIFGCGIGSAWRTKLHPWLDKRDFYILPLITCLLALTVLFTFILRSESIFDEYLHLPLISIMAAGDIPPHFYLNPDFYFAYHYGIQVFAASLVRLAGFFPWSAWDISRALAIVIYAGFGVVMDTQSHT